MYCLLFEDATPCCIPAHQKTFQRSKLSSHILSPVLFSQLMCDQLPWPLVHAQIQHTVQELHVLRGIVLKTMTYFVHVLRTQCVHGYICLSRERYLLYTPFCSSVLNLHLYHLFVLLPLAPNCYCSPLTPHPSPLTIPHLPSTLSHSSNRDSVGDSFELSSMFIS